MDFDLFNNQLPSLLQHMTTLESVNSIEYKKDHIVLQIEVLIPASSTTTTVPEKTNNTAVELFITVSYSELYQVPVINFRIYQCTQPPIAENTGIRDNPVNDNTGADVDVEVEVEEKKLIFSQDVLTTLIFRPREARNLRTEHTSVIQQSNNDDTIDNDNDIDSFLLQRTNISASFTETARLEFSFPQSGLESSIKLTEHDSRPYHGPFYLIHPCQTKELLDQFKENNNNKETLLVAWWRFYSKVLL